MRQNFYLSTILFLIFTVTTFAQDLKITAVEVQSEPNVFGGKVIVTINGEEQRVIDEGYQAWIVNNGKEMVYSSRDGAGGFENEGQSLHIYDVTTGKTRKIMSEYSMVDGLTEKKLSNGHKVLLVRMSDGGLGGSYFAVVDPKRGQVLSRGFAELSAIKGDTITLSYFKENDWERISEERGVDEYDKRTAFAAKTKVKPLKIETLDLKKIIKGKVIVNRNSFEMNEPKWRKVELFFWRADDEGKDGNFVLGTVEREVVATAPLTPTLQALFIGVAKNEEGKGFTSPTFGMKFEGVVLKNGVATVKFSQPKDQTNYGSLGPFIFLKAIEKTAKQFPSVKKVVVCAIGETMIDSQLDKQFPRCK
jgi:hypothetical protein